MSFSPLEADWAEMGLGWRNWEVAMTRCKTSIKSYGDLPPSMALHKQRRQPMFDAIPPPYLTLDQEDYYDAQYESMNIKAMPLSSHCQLLTRDHRVDR